MKDKLPEGTEVAYNPLDSNRVRRFGRVKRHYGDDELRGVIVTSLEDPDKENVVPYDRIQAIRDNA